MFHQCWLLCLSASWQDYTKTTAWIFMELGGRFEHMGRIHWRGSRKRDSSSGSRLYVCFRMTFAALVITNNYVHYNQLVEMISLKKCQRKTILSSEGCFVDPTIQNSRIPRHIPNSCPGNNLVLNPAGKQTNQPLVEVNEGKVNTVLSLSLRNICVVLQRSL